MSNYRLLCFSIINKTSISGLVLMLLSVLVTKQQQQQQQQQIQITIKNSGSKSCEDLKSRKIFKFSYLFLIKQTNGRQSHFYMT